MAHAEINETVAEEVQAAEAVERLLVEAGANDAVINSLWTPYVHWSADLRFGGPLLNAHSIACKLLLNDPEATLAEKIIPMPKNIVWLGRQVIQLHNQSITRDADGPYAWDGTTRTGLAVCSTAEERFTYSLNIHSDQLITNSWDGTPNEVYLDNTNVVAYKKGVIVPSAISFEEIAIGGIAFPPGTLLQIVRDKRHQGKLITENLMAYDVSAIRAIGALRLSSLAFEPGIERQEAFRGPAGIEDGEKFTQLSDLQYRLNAIISQKNSPTS